MSAPFSCFNCRDENTPLYCLNCAGIILKNECDELREKLEAAERDGKAAIASLNDVSKFSADGMKALTEKLATSERSNAAMRQSLETVLEVAELIDDETGHQSRHIKEALATTPPSEWVRKSECDKWEQACRERTENWREVLVTVYDFFRFQAYEHEAESTGRRLFNEKADTITQVLEGATAPPPEWVRRGELDSLKLALEQILECQHHKCVEYMIAERALKTLRGEK